VIITATACLILILACSILYHADRISRRLLVKADERIPINRPAAFYPTLQNGVLIKVGIALFSGRAMVPAYGALVLPVSCA
jgi:hypothetical protein